MKVSARIQLSASKLHKFEMSPAELLLGDGGEATFVDLFTQTMEGNGAEFDPASVQVELSYEMDSFGMFGPFPVAVVVVTAELTGARAKADR